MPLRILLRGTELSADGESVDVHVEIYDMRARQGLNLHFTVKREGSLDAAVKEAERQLQNFGQELFQAVSVENPLLRTITRQP
ncbi:MAG: hypothetical protein ACLPKB_28945 [Xanthobacteraceae bacterium]